MQTARICQELQSITLCPFVPRLLKVEPVSPLGQNMNPLRGVVQLITDDDTNATADDNPGLSAVG
jgi:hypothetical protein